MKWFFILLTLISNAFTAEQKFTDFAVLKAQFKQRRALARLAHPLESTGDFVFVKGKGILWNVKTPYPKTVLISSAGIKVLNADDEKATSSNESFGGYERVLGQILEKVLNGSVDVIDSMDGFDTEILLKRESIWKKKLVPKDETIKQFVPAIIIEGEDFITRVEIQKAKGEWDELLFIEHKSCGSLQHCVILADSERKAFE